MEKNGGHSEFVIVINTPPKEKLKAATCDVYPRTGLEFEKSFKATCLGFIDDDLPLKYIYSYLMNGTYRPLFATTMPETNSFMLPVGVTTVRAVVADFLGAERPPIDIGVTVSSSNIFLLSLQLLAVLLIDQKHHF